MRDGARIPFAITALVLALTLATACSAAPSTQSQDASEPATETQAETPVKESEPAQVSEPVEAGPTYVKVPNVTADNQDDAVEILEEAGFTVALAYAVSSFSPYYTYPHVMAQYPSGYAEEGSCVTITIATSTEADLVSEYNNVPDVAGQSVVDATATLEEHGRPVTEIDGPEDGVVVYYEVTGSSPPSGTLHTTPTAGNLENPPGPLPYGPEDYEYHFSLAPTY